jgi:hypothetical protein
LLLSGIGLNMELFPNSKMIHQGRIQRLTTFIARPLLLALFISILFNFNSHSNPAKPHDAHPHLSKALIIASTTASNLTWLPSPKNSPWTQHIYVVDDPSASLTVPVNKGNEAMVYLTFIIDHYHDLPDVMFFHHDHSQAWHQLFSSSFELGHLNPQTVINQKYVSPRCLPDCENIIQLSGDVVPLHDLKSASRDIQISTILHEFLRDEEGKRLPVPEKIAAPCCAQFAVSREAVLKRKRETWEGLRRWLIETEVGSRASGRVLEYTWHLWFGMDAVL